MQQNGFHKDYVHSEFVFPVVKQQFWQCFISVMTDVAYGVSRVLDRIVWASTSNL
jgi:hypothetical protein